jgi:release factor glutamine methyltransferase
VLGARRLDLYLQPERPVGEAELETYRGMVRRRLRREPVQYILGETRFRELLLRVDRRALIPRPETEVLVGVVLEWTAMRQATRPAPMSALDIGTGSGAIALSLAREGRFERVVATDSSSEALALARENAERCGLSGPVEFRHGPTWTTVARDERFTTIVANPPYIGEAERGTLAPEVADWEPPAALFAGVDGLLVLDEIVAHAADHLEPGGLLALEVGVTQTEHVAARLRASSRFEEPRVVADLTGRPRIVSAMLAPQPGRKEDAADHGARPGAGSPTRTE